MSSTDSLKLKTARSVKWSAIDRFASQGLYAITGIFLANLLTPDEFGLVGAALIFQAFAAIIVDSGFSYALIQRKAPTRLDYSSVLWFNLTISILLYIGLWFCAPLIADCFQHDQRLTPIARAIFITMPLNASAIVQINQLTKQMNLKPVTIANTASLVIGGLLGIWMAFSGYGAWAIVGQSIANSGLKSLILWCTSRWTPLVKFSYASLKSFFKVGSGMMLTSFLNTIFLKIYSFLVGNQLGMARLGYYTQGEKWSTMGIMSLSQTLTSSFLPPLSAAQDDKERFRRLCHKMNRVTAYAMYPCLIGLCLMAAPIFHSLFGQKWDASIIIFQLLLIRGIFTVLSGLYTNFMLALGHSREIFTMEVIRDTIAIGALVVTFPYMSIERIGAPVYGIEIMLYGQILASIVAFILNLIWACRLSGATCWSFICDNLPYLALTLVISPLLYWLATLPWNSWFILMAQCASGALLYLIANYLLRSKVQADALAYLRGRL